MLAGVHDGGASGYLSDRPVQPQVVVGVLAQIAVRPDGQRPGSEPRDVASAVDRAAQYCDPRRADALPAAEGGLPDLGPKFAVRERKAAAASFAFYDAALPEMDDLTDRAHARQFAEQALHQRAPAAAKAAEVDNSQGSVRHAYQPDVDSRNQHVPA